MEIANSPGGQKQTNLRSKVLNRGNTLPDATGVRRAAERPAVCASRWFTGLNRAHRLDTHFRRQGVRAGEGDEKPETSDQPGDFPVVGIGASAGGLESLERLFSRLPANTGMAFVVL